MRMHSITELQKYMKKKDNRTDQRLQWFYTAGITDYIEFSSGKVTEHINNTIHKSPATINLGEGR